jgi:hypothetical protein
VDVVPLERKCEMKVAAFWSAVGGTEVPNFDLQVSLHSGSVCG